MLNRSVVTSPCFQQPDNRLKNYNIYPLVAQTYHAPHVFPTLHGYNEYKIAAPIVQYIIQKPGYGDTLAMFWHDYKLGSAELIESQKGEPYQW